MMRQKMMLRYEVKKLFSMQLFRYGLLLLAISLGAIIYRSASSESMKDIRFTEADEIYEKAIAGEEYYDELEADYLALKNMLSSDAEAMTTAKGNYSQTLMGDFVLLGSFINDAQYINAFPEKRMEIIKKALDDAQRAPDSASRKYHQKVAECYNSVIAVKLCNSFSVTKWATDFRENSLVNFFNMLLILWITILSSTFFCGESAQIGVVIKSTFGGRRRLFAAKLGTLCSVSAIVCVFLFVTELLAGVFLYGIDGNVLSAPVQSISLYSLCTFNLNFLQLLIISSAMRLLACWLVISVCGFVCTVSHNSVISSFGVAVIFEGIMFAINYIISAGSYQSNLLLAKIRMLCPICILYPEYYFTSFDYGNVFGAPINRFLLCLMLTTATFVITTVLSIALSESCGYNSRRKRNCGLK